MWLSSHLPGERGGLGYREICTFLNEKCGMCIVIPEIEEGYYEKRVIEYQKRQAADQRNRQGV